jgi:hypothetical protein
VPEIGLAALTVVLALPALDQMAPRHEQEGRDDQDDPGPYAVIRPKEKGGAFAPPVTS